MCNTYQITSFKSFLTPRLVLIEKPRFCSSLSKSLFAVYGWGFLGGGGTPKMYLQTFKQTLNETTIDNWEYVCLEQ